jgi:hypothetical protein
MKVIYKGSEKLTDLKGKPVFYDEFVLSDMWDDFNPVISPDDLEFLHKKIGEALEERKKVLATKGR